MHYKWPKCFQALVICGVTVDLQSLFGLHVNSYTHWLRPCNLTSPPPPLWAHIRGRYSQSTYFTVRGQSYFSRLPKCWPPSPSPPGECVPPPLLRGEDRLAERRGGWGSIFWKTREIGLPSYRKYVLCGAINEPRYRRHLFAVVTPDSNHTFI